MFVTELQTRLDRSKHSKEKIETGFGLDDNFKKQFSYRTSELRLTEALHEPHICEQVLDYNVHAERAGSRRYGKGQSETMGTLHDLVHKGVKVELGIPYDLWDKPSAEVSKMHRACFNLAEKYEDDIEDWYYNHQDDAVLSDYVCKQRYLKHKNWDDSCLDEQFKGDYEDYRPEHAPSHFKKGEDGEEGPDGELEGDGIPPEEKDEEPSKKKKNKKKKKKSKAKGDTDQKDEL